MLKRILVKKVTILGTTGAGKTTFLQALFGDFQKNDVKRNVKLEKRTNVDFTPVERVQFDNSTTTISLNVISAIMARTRFNSIIMKKAEHRHEIDFSEVDEARQVIFNDPAGQERFGFMQEISVKGADLVIIMADGTNISSIQKISYYLDLVALEEQRSNKNIPIVIFVNKSDLKSKGIYLGKEIVEQIISSYDREVIIYETSNFQKKTLEEPMAIISNFLLLEE